MMNTNHDIRAVHRSQGILQGEIVDCVFSMSAITAGQNTWLRFNQNCEKVASAAYTLKRTEEMNHTSPQCESTKAGCNDRAYVNDAAEVAAALRELSVDGRPLFMDQTYLRYLDDGLPRWRMLLDSL